MIALMKKPSDLPPENDNRVPLDDAQFAVVVLAVASFILIIFVLIITLWMT
ncbi:hypothetical protein [Izhakiella australiensis]|uniref:hypothetical protein n=1 Tax=Izhakiella australiensis TaxID=1926881 RepID=UPI00159118BB|nr:hypothetical protein [Izhakiella australiensis]